MRKFIINHKIILQVHVLKRNIGLFSGFVWDADEVFFSVVIFLLLRLYLCLVCAVSDWYMDHIYISPGPWLKAVTFEAYYSFRFELWCSVACLVYCLLPYSRKSRELRLRRGLIGVSKINCCFFAIFLIYQLTKPLLRRLVFTKEVLKLMLHALMQCLIIC